MKFFITFIIAFTLVFFGGFLMIWIFGVWLCVDWERFQYLTDDPKKVRVMCDPSYMP